MGSGPTAGRMNPGLGAAMSILSTGGSMAAAGATAPADASGERVVETVQDGLTKAGRQVADELKKGKSPAAQKK
jgi:hypothetical protein